MSSPSATSVRRENSNPVKEVDLVIWTKNSSATLAMVLKRLEKVVPQKFVRNKIIVDDHSVDNTIEIGRLLDGKSILMKVRVFLMVPTRH
jgi:glycosyltransferase involved in cell wall biosynthesis